MNNTNNIPSNEEIKQHMIELHQQADTWEAEIKTKYTFKEVSTIYQLRTNEFNKKFCPADPQVMEVKEEDPEGDLKKEAMKGWNLMNTLLNIAQQYPEIYFEVSNELYNTKTDIDMLRSLGCFEKQ